MEKELINNIKKNMVEEQLFQIIRYFLKNEPVTDTVDWSRLWILAKKHSLGQFVSLYMKQLPEEQRPDKELQNVISNSFAVLIAQQVNQKNAIKNIHLILETNECYHLFMKGSITRNRYGSPYWRTMGDIDFLYQEAQHRIVKKSLLENGISEYREGRKNDTYYQKPYVCVEAHRQMVPSESSFFPYCSNVWERAHVSNGSKYLYEMSIEDELIFNIIHLSIHFLEGGAGIRFILDVYVYNNLKINIKYVEQELLKLDLLDFYHNISALSEYWFGDGEKTEITEKLAAFILENGTFGTRESSSALSVREGRWKFLKKMCFPSYQEMVSLYPWLKNKKLFLPLAWLIRGFGVLKHKRGTLRSQFRKARLGDKNLGKDLQKLYQECGLRCNL